jgi:hypothetical protein
LKGGSSDRDLGRVEADSVPARGGGLRLGFVEEGDGAVVEPRKVQRLPPSQHNSLSVSVTRGVYLRRQNLPPGKEAPFEETQLMYYSKSQPKRQLETITKEELSEGVSRATLSLPNEEREQRGRKKERKQRHQSSSTTTAESASFRRVL